MPSSTSADRPVAASSRPPPDLPMLLVPVAQHGPPENERYPVIGNGFERPNMSPRQGRPIQSRSSLDSTSHFSTLSIDVSAGPPPHQHHSHPGRLRAFWLRNKGVLLVLLAQVFGSGMNVAARLMETDGRHGRGMHPFQILFSRMSLTTLLSLAYGFYTRIPHFPLGPTTVRSLLILRGLGGFFGVFGLYTSLLYLPLSEATVLTFLAPILTCYACSMVIVGERFSRGQQVAGWVSLWGVVFIARPGFIFGSNGEDDGDSSGGGGGGGEKGKVTSHQHTLAILFSLLGVLGATTAMTTIRKIGTRAHPLISVNYFSSWCTLVSLVAVLAVPGVGFRLPGNAEEWGLLLLLGVFGFVMQFLLTAGLAYGGPGSGNGSRELGKDGDAVRDREGDTGIVSVEEGGEERVKASSSSSSTSTSGSGTGSGTRATSMLYTQMLFALAFDKLIWGLSPTWSSWVGSGIILACAVWVAAAKDMQGKDKDNAEFSDERGSRRGKGEGREEEEEEQQALMGGSHSLTDIEAEGGAEEGRDANPPSHGPELTNTGPSTGSTSRSTLS